MMAAIETVSPYHCTHAHCASRPLLTASTEGLKCPEGHFFPFLPGTQIPVFSIQPPDANEYSVQRAAEIHDNALKWLFKTFKTDEATLRQSLLQRLDLKKGQRILITGAGAGNDLSYVKKLLESEGEIHAQDIAAEMLAEAANRHGALAADKCKLFFNVSDAANLPFGDSYFDAAYHFGGINLFSDVQRGFSEMSRVVKEGGKVVIGDEGTAPWLKNTEYAQILSANNALYDCNVPLHCIPELARDVQVSWELSNTFWVIEFKASRSPLPFDMDVPHAGKRGGSVRKRYFGKLEGVEPELRDAVFALAQQKKISHVALLEQILHEGLQKHAGTRHGS